MNAKGFEIYCSFQKNPDTIPRRLTFIGVCDEDFVPPNEMEWYRLTDSPVDDVHIWSITIHLPEDIAERWSLFSKKTHFLEALKGMRCIKDISSVPTLELN